MTKQITKTDPTTEENLTQQDGDTPQEATEATQDDASTVNDQSPTDTPDDAQDTPQDDNETTGNKVHREAAKYRTQLRAAEVELEQARSNRDQLATQVIENLLPSHVPAKVFWKLTDAVNTFLGDDGLVDASVVEAAAKQVAEDLGIQKQRGGPVIKSQADMPDDVSTGNSYVQAFGPQH